MRKSKSLHVAVAGQAGDAGPVIRDCYVISQIILAGLREAPKYADNKDFNKERTPVFISALSKFPGAEPYVQRYGNLNIVVKQGEDRSTGSYYPRRTKLELYYKRKSVGVMTSNLKALLTADAGTLQHELRHWIDDVTDAKKHIALNNPKDPQVFGFAAYYSQEHEVDARLADLLIRVDMGFMGAAIKVLRGKADSDTPMFYEALKSVGNFQQFVLRVDRAFAQKSLSVGQALQRDLLPEDVFAEALGKIDKFYKLMYDDYGMAFRVTPKQDVTSRRTAAWKSLKEIASNKKTVTQHMAETRERELTTKLVKIIGPEAKPAVRAAARKKLGIMRKKVTTAPVSSTKKTKKGK